MSESEESPAAAPWCKLVFNDDTPPVDVASTEYAIGRGPDNDKVVDCVRVSFRHCKLTRSEGNDRVILKDTSSNGTHVRSASDQQIHFLQKSERIIDWGDKVEIRLSADGSWSQVL